MKEDENRCGGCRKLAFDAADTITFMKHKHINVMQVKVTKIEAPRRLL